MSAPAGAAAPATVPAPARTHFRLVGGGAGPTLWDLVHDSPIVKALPFVDWALNAAGSHREAPRSQLAGALLLQADRPAAASLLAFDTFAFVEREMGHAEASNLAHILDKAGAWSNKGLCRLRRLESRQG